MRLSTKARQHILKSPPKLRKIAGEIRRKQGIEVLAIGKESIPVRIAELTACAHAITYACTKAIEDKAPVFIGLPTKCQHRTIGNRVYLYSLMATEHDIRGFAEWGDGTLGKVDIVETLNPDARGFRALKIAPETWKVAAQITRCLIHHAAAKPFNEV